MARILTVANSQPLMTAKDSNRRRRQCCRNYNFIGSDDNDDNDAMPTDKMSNMEHGIWTKEKHEPDVHSKLDVDGDRCRRKL